MACRNETLTAFIIALPQKENSFKKLMISARDYPCLPQTLIMPFQFLYPNTRKENKSDSYLPL